MIQLFYGDDRVKIDEAVKKIFGADYEVIDGASIEEPNLQSIFYGTSLLVAERKILIKDLGDNKEIFPRLTEFLDTPHEVIIWETKLDKRTTVYKELEKQIKIKEFAVIQMKPTTSFDIYAVAKRDGKRAVQMLEKIRDELDPYYFVGGISSQAIKEFTQKPGAKEKRVLLELSKLDMSMKTTSLQPWLLVESFLLQLSSW